MALERLEQRGGEPEVALHELGLVLWAVDAGQVEDEVGAGAEVLQLPGRRVEVVLHDLEGQQARVLLAAVLAVPYVLQRAAEVPAHEAPRACDEDAPPYCTASCSRPSRASCTYSAVLILAMVPSTSSLSVLWEV